MAFSNEISPKSFGEETLPKKNQKTYANIEAKFPIIVTEILFKKKILFWDIVYFFYDTQIVIKNY